ncbi:acetoacetate--CoA ligase [Balneatrix alpica]|uniref:Acetoacetate--CoA ligase n=1 Tax=Balneatrix alpica TaxID=75684 RepID=A0ABV5Z912_9GAMM|nr:acetoacetate--CoA ligase [Balneatrix alpica]
MNAPLWQPCPDRLTATQMWQFLQHINQQQQLELQDYADLYQWSIQHPVTFWSQFWHWAGVRGTPGSRPLINADNLPQARWFVDGTLNFTDNLLHHRDERTALIFRNERGERQALSYEALYEQVASLALALKCQGIQPGDRIAALLPNCIETVVAMLASASVGAIWSSCSPDFGAAGVLDRFAQIAPLLLFASDGSHYNGKALPILDKVAAISAQLSSLERVIIIPRLQERPPLDGLDSRACLWEDFLSPGALHLDTPAFAFNHPLYILYSSGTTGVPKCILHGAGGTLLQHLKEHRLHLDLKRDDVFFYYSTCGWMMWNWLVSGLASGATLVLYDGSPLYPHPGSLWDMADEERISIFGCSAKYLAHLAKAGIKPATSHHLGALRMLLSTGSPLTHESYDYVYRDIKADLCLSSISGGTDIISCFALGNPILPVWRGQLQCRGLGMAVAIWDEQGHPLEQGKGELVCTHPFPSMPLGFWGDEDGQRFQEAYFSRFANVWTHGDYAELTATGGMIIHGRSDALLNPGGVRIGTAEIYRQVEQIEEVMESLAISQDWQDDVRILLFVVLQPGLSLDDALRERIRQQIRQHTSPRHVPAKIIQVAELPRTRSGKLVELAVRRVVHGQDVPNLEALANPQALEAFRNLPELQH